MKHLQHLLGPRSNQRARSQSAVYRSSLLIFQSIIYSDKLPSTPYPRLIGSRIQIPAGLMTATRGADPCSRTSVKVQQPSMFLKAAHLAYLCIPIS